MGLKKFIYKIYDRYPKWITIPITVIIILIVILIFIILFELALATVVGIIAFIIIIGGLIAFYIISNLISRIDESKIHKMQYDDDDDDSDDDSDYDPVIVHDPYKLQEEEIEIEETDQYRKYTVIHDKYHKFTYNFYNAERLYLELNRSKIPNFFKDNYARYVDMHEVNILHAKDVVLLFDKDKQKYWKNFNKYNELKNMVNDTEDKLKTLKNHKKEIDDIHEMKK